MDDTQEEIEIPIQTGVIEDPRSEEQKAKDFTHDEILAGGFVPAIQWLAKTAWKTIDIRDQINSSSCGGQSLAKIITRFFGSIMSASPLYKFRANFPSEGMYQQNVGSIGLRRYTTTEAICPSEKMTEAQMNDANIPAELPYGVAAYYFLPAGQNLNMDLLAQALEAGHALHIGVNSNNPEYTPVPVSNGGETTFSHFVACIDKENYLLWTDANHTGEKAIVIDDSCAVWATLNKSGQKIFTESFMKARVWGIMALVPFTEDGLPIKPVHVFNTDLKSGMQSDEIAELQNCLKIEGVFPKEIPSTGFFGNVTKKAVNDFQWKYQAEILAPAGLKQPTGIVAEHTRAKLNALYGSNS